jgi:hypothetical protein
MRHSDIKLTMEVYTDVQQLDEAEALAAMPELPVEKRRERSSTTTEGTGSGTPRTG